MAWQSTVDHERNQVKTSDGVGALTSYAMVMYDPQLVFRMPRGFDVAYIWTLAGRGDSLTFDTIKGEGG